MSIVTKIETSVQICLDLSNDFRNLEHYSRNRPLQTELLLVAEEKIAILAGRLMQFRQELGIRGSAQIVEMNRG